MKAPWRISRVAARRVRDFAALDFLEVVLEVGDRRLLDELVGVAVDRLDAGFEQLLLRAAADLGDEYRGAVVDGADHGFAGLSSSPKPPWQ